MDSNILTGDVMTILERELTFRKLYGDNAINYFLTVECEKTCVKGEYLACVVDTDSKKTYRLLMYDNGCLLDKVVWDFTGFIM